MVGSEWRGTDELVDHDFARRSRSAQGNARRHEDVLTIALVASICGCESCVEFADFGEDREELFREFLGLENGLPSHDTFSRLFRLIDPEALSASFGRFLDVLGEDGAGVVAIDGKTLRRSFDRVAGQSALHVVTAFAADARLVIGRKAVPAGGNEITAARALLELLDLKGTLVTADAIHCQRETAALVLARGGDYLFALKANRPAMLSELEAFFADPQAEGVHRCETTDANHGRIEVRRHAVSGNVAWLVSDRRHPGEAVMPGLASIAMVEAEVERDGRITRSHRFYLASAHSTPERFAAAVRAHWGIDPPLPSSTKTAPATARTTAPKTSPSSANAPSTPSSAPAQTSRSAANASAPGGPTLSHDPSSAKCDSPACTPPASWRGQHNLRYTR